MVVEPDANVDKFPDRKRDSDNTCHEQGYDSLTKVTEHHDTTCSASSYWPALDRT